MRPAAVTGTAAGFSVSGGRIAFIRRLLPIGGQGGGEKRRAALCGKTGARD